MEQVLHTDQVKFGINTVAVFRGCVVKCTIQSNDNETYLCKLRHIQVLIPVFYTGSTRNWSVFLHAYHD